MASDILGYDIDLAQTLEDIGEAADAIDENLFDAEQAADTAEEQAGIATTKAGEASDDAADALAHKNAAETAALEASISAAGSRRASRASSAFARQSEAAALRAEAAGIGAGVLYVRTNSPDPLPDLPNGTTVIVTAEAATLTLRDYRIPPVEIGLPSISGLATTPFTRWFWVLLASPAEGGFLTFESPDPAVLVYSSSSTVDTHLPSDNDGMKVLRRGGLRLVRWVEGAYYISGGPDAPAP